jgi:hypothetical protein
VLVIVDVWVWTLVTVLVTVWVTVGAVTVVVVVTVDVTGGMVVVDEVEVLVELVEEPAPVFHNGVPWVIDPRPAPTIIWLFWRAAFCSFPWTPQAVP